MEILSHLNRLMEFESVSEDRECCKAALRYVIELAKSFGLEARTGRYGDVGIVDLGEGPETVGILVHVDVVAEGNPQLWDFAPYERAAGRGHVRHGGIKGERNAAERRFDFLRCC